MKQGSNKNKPDYGSLPPLPEVALPTAQPAEQSLRNAVAAAVQRYLTELDGELTTDVYQMVLAEIEVPLLQQVMDYTAHNQTRAARMLGLNRGTLRKKLKQYNLLLSGEAL